MIKQFLTPREDSNVDAWVMPSIRLLGAAITAVARVDT